MKKFLFVPLLVAFSAAYTKAANALDNVSPPAAVTPLDDRYHGLLRPGLNNIDPGLGKYILEGIVREDQNIFATYCIQVNNFPVQSAKRVVKMEIALRLGRSDASQLGDDEAIANIESMQMQNICGLWTQPGFASWRIDDYGQDDASYLPNRQCENYLMLNGQPAFSLWCLNAVKNPSPQITQPQQQTQYEQYTQYQQYQQPQMYGTPNNNYNYNYNYNTGGQGQSTPVYVERQKGNGWAVAGAAVVGGVLGYVLGRNHQPYYYAQGPYFNQGYQRDYYSYPRYSGNYYHYNTGGYYGIGTHGGTGNTSTLNSTPAGIYTTPPPGGYYGRPRRY